MKKILHSIIIITVAMLTTGCAELGIRGSVSSDARKNIRNVAVYSGFGTEMNHTLIATTVFFNEYNKVPVAQWDIKGFSEQETINALKEMGIGQSASVFNKKLHSFNPIDAAKIAHASGYDTLVVLEPSRYGNMHLMEEGYGIFNRTQYLMEVYNCPYASFIVRAVDTKTAKSLGWQWGFDLLQGPCASEKVRWQENPNNYTAQDIKIIEGAIKKKIASGIRIALKDLLM
ncbi:MAG: hypothetical protein ACK502_07700 [Alphaproteobacteria bacterium]